jgi:3-dehydroquinate synthase
VKAFQVMIVTNASIAPLYLSSVQEAFSKFQCDVVVIPDGEAYKNQEGLFAIYDGLIENQHHRDTTLVALGGGVVGDITGFAAATYQRGVRFIQAPTTLLAQVDASIGGKTAINHRLGKNMIGSFHQPHAVLMDLTTLSTLPEREFCAGFAEIIKYALLVGGNFLKKVDALLEQGYSSMTLPQQADLIAQCCDIKANFVQEDEKEIGRRALLNLGHTFAHALEVYTNYRRWLHGEAVGIGLYCAALLSYASGSLDKCHLLSVDSLLANAKLPRRIPKEIDLDKLQDLMFSDKKIVNKKLRFVLMRAPGDCYIETEITADSLRYVLMNAVEGEKS